MVGHRGQRAETPNGYGPWGERKNERLVVREGLLEVVTFTQRPKGVNCGGPLGRGHSSVSKTQRWAELGRAGVQEAMAGEVAL